MPEEITVNHEQLVKIFARWDREAKEGQWDPNLRDEEACADYFMEIAVEETA